MIFCVEDDNNIRDLLVYTLETTGFHARGLEDSQELWKALAEEEPELILLDIMLPGEDGYSILEKLKKSSGTRDIPIIMVTAKEAEFDKVRALEAGADDYIVKPFSPKELLARINSLLRRLSIQVDDIQEDENELQSGIFRLVVDERRFTKDGEEIELTPIEFSLVKYFMENANKAIHRDEILNNVWGYNYVGDFKIVDVNIRRIRQKIEDDPSEPKFIEKVWGYGYRWWGGD